MTYVLQVAAILIQVIGQIIFNAILNHKLLTYINLKRIAYILVQCFRVVYVIVLHQMADVYHYLKFYFQTHAHLIANTVSIKSARKK